MVVLRLLHLHFYPPLPTCFYTFLHLFPTGSTPPHLKILSNLVVFGLTHLFCLTSANLQASRLRGRPPPQGWSLSVPLQHTSLLVQTSSYSSTAPLPAPPSQFHLMTGNSCSSFISLVDPGDGSAGETLKSTRNLP